MSSISTEAKVGLFVLVGLLLLAYMSFKVGQEGFGFKKGYEISVVFDNVAGLERDASVQIAGVEVGRVQSIGLRNGRALVVLRINPDIELQRDVRAAIKTHGILGDKYIEIYPGSPGVEPLAQGGQITQVEHQADIDRLLNQLALIADDIKKVTGSLSSVLGGREGEASIESILESTRQLTYNLNMVVKNNEATLQAMLENTRQLTENLNGVVTRNDDKVAQAIDNLRGASGEMQKAFTSMREITEGIQRGEGNVGQLVKDRTLVDRLNKTLSSLQEVSDKINQGRGTIGKLVNEEETVNNLNESLSGVSRYVNKAEQFRTFLSYRGEYLFDNSDAKSYLDVRIQPKEDKYYVVGIVSDPRGKRTTKDYTSGGVTTRVEEWDRDDLLFNAQIAKRYRDLVLRGGLLESTGGVGIDYLSLNDRLKLSFEAFDFSSDRKTHLKAGAEFRLFKHLYLTGGWDDFISDEDNSSPYAGFSIRFEDDDLKYLMTSTPIPQ